MRLLQLRVAVLNLLCEPLLVMLKELALFLVLHFEGHDFFLLLGELSGDLLNFVLELVFELADPLLSPLQVERLLLETLLDSCDLAQRLGESLVALRFFHSPIGGDLLYLIDFLLFQMDQEF